MILGTHLNSEEKAKVYYNNLNNKVVLESIDNGVFTYKMLVVVDEICYEVIIIKKYDNLDNIILYDLHDTTLGRLFAIEDMLFTEFHVLLAHND